MKKKFHFTTTHILLIGFLSLILIGAILLMLPVAASNRQMTPFVDALFTSTTSVCVTGLVTVNTLSHWSTFGHVVILILIQVGGLGFVSFTTIFMLLIGKRISIKGRMLIQDAYNLDTFTGLLRVTKRVVIGSFVVEGIGALFYMIRFIPMLGIGTGIWRSIFLAISCFCNAGIDLVGDASLAPFVTDPLINIVTVALIIVSGLGFAVWWDVLAAFGRLKKDGFRRHVFTRCSLQTKMVLTMTLILVVGGTLFIAIADWNHPGSLGDLHGGQKVLAALFQSVTLRTAGFQTIPQEAFSSGTQLLSMAFMFIGGSPAGTAGGVKTVTVMVIILSVLAHIFNGKDVEVYGRRLPDGIVRKAVSVFSISFIFLIISMIALSIAMPEANIMDIMYECTSAIATVGLSRSFTGTLNTIGKIVIICTMYLGRIGPISMTLIFNVQSRSKKAGRQLPEEKIIVG